MRRERERRNLTQEELAYESGLHPTQISHIEAGSRKPRFDTIIKLAEALRVTPAKLFEGIR